MGRVEDYIDYTRRADMENACICCGAIIPEGRQVCPMCEKATCETKNKRKKIIWDKNDRLRNFINGNKLG